MGPCHRLAATKELHGAPCGLCFLAGSFTYKTGRPICLCTGCGHKVRIPSFEHSEDPGSGVLYRVRLTTNTKHYSSAHVSKKKGKHKMLGSLVEWKSPLRSEHTEYFTVSFRLINLCRSSSDNCVLCLLNSSAKVLNANKDLVVRDSAMQLDGGGYRTSYHDHMVLSAF